MSRLSECQAEHEKETSQTNQQVVVNMQATIRE
jgi:hypothetical protein